ncbi:hypothetical protein FP435_00010 (plasmid) [Lactobacillus sp. PV037]|uniref:hypothetical protein n=1 Tax=Lactobacillus sp. PV037 TaxID=2594496 RepID=UPI00223F6BAD|nr:hypothetical protein [Lactobacillus sp. PV037]QNQ83008.1 hypothetical protein FP435_00010 [Lactobacillus sp. PV037]
MSSSVRDAYNTGSKTVKQKALKELQDKVNAITTNSEYTEQMKLSELEETRNDARKSLARLFSNSDSIDLVLAKLIDPKITNQKAKLLTIPHKKPTSKEITPEDNDFFMTWQDGEDNSPHLHDSNSLVIDDPPFDDIEDNDDPFDL